MKIIRYIKRWNEWRKGNRNSILYKFLVLIKVRRSPTLEHFWTEEQGKAFYEGFMEGLKNGK